MDRNSKPSKMSFQFPIDNLFEQLFGAKSARTGSASSTSPLIKMAWADWCCQDDTGFQKQYFEGDQKPISGPQQLAERVFNVLIQRHSYPSPKRLFDLCRALIRLLKHFGENETMIPLLTGAEKDTTFKHISDFGRNKGNYLELVGKACQDPNVFKWPNRVHSQEPPRFDSFQALLDSKLWEHFGQDHGYDEGQAKYVVGSPEFGWPDNSLVRLLLRPIEALCAYAAEKADFGLGDRTSFGLIDAFIRQGWGYHNPQPAGTFNEFTPGFPDHKFCAAHFCPPPVEFRWGSRGAAKNQVAWKDMNKDLPMFPGAGPGLKTQAPGFENFRKLFPFSGFMPDKYFLDLRYRAREKLLTHQFGPQASGGVPVGWFYGQLDELAVDPLKAGTFDQAPGSTMPVLCWARLVDGVNEEEARAGPRDDQKAPDPLESVPRGPRVTADKDAEWTEQSLEMLQQRDWQITGGREWAALEDAPRGWQRRRTQPPKDTPNNWVPYVVAGGAALAYFYTR